MRSFQLSNEEIKELAARHRTPFLVLSVDKVEENYFFLRQHLSRAKICYAMKANPDHRILKRLASLGSCFDVASAGEIEALHALGIAGSRMIYANPVKDLSGLEAARRCGVHRFTFDDLTEIPKIAEFVPGADVLVRIQVKNAKALVDLNTKFGAHPDDAIPLLKAARAAGLRPVGICFHVGSQSLSKDAYEEALLYVHGLFSKAKAAGLPLTDLDIGGGFPIPSANPVSGEPETGAHGAQAHLDVDVIAMLEGINRQLYRLFPHTQVYCEPGRFLPGSAVNLVASVIGTKLRGQTPWYILDEGIYGCFSGILFDHWTYPMRVVGHEGKPLVPSVFAGPSCDGIDVLYRDFPAPRLSVGDQVLAMDIGAYTTVSATRFNGFALAPVYAYEKEFPAASRTLRAAAR